MNERQYANIHKFRKTTKYAYIDHVQRLVYLDLRVDVAFAFIPTEISHQQNTAHTLEKNHTLHIHEFNIAESVDLSGCNTPNTFRQLYYVHTITCRRWFACALVCRVRVQ